EVAAVRYILIKYNSIKVNGFVFYSNLNILNLFNKFLINLRARIFLVTYLIKAAIFRPKYITNQLNNFFLNIYPLIKLIEIYYIYEVKDYYNKIYALLGINSNNFIGLRRN
ncbi:hypothetical protein B0H65DRAFT_405316, partial [Neurospora tetraspora]